MEASGILRYVESNKKNPEGSWIYVARNADGSCHL